MTRIGILFLGRPLHLVTRLTFRDWLDWRDYNGLRLEGGGGGIQGDPLEEGEEEEEEKEKKKTVRNVGLCWSRRGLGRVNKFLKEFRHVGHAMKNGVVLTERREEERRKKKKDSPKKKEEEERRKKKKGRGNN